jgi:hypothetical protein
MEQNKTTVLVKASLIDVPDKAVANVDNLQPDLLYFDSILVSTGQNLNDDVFLHNEMWGARKSPIFKPVDWEHETGSEILDGLEGNPRKVVRDNQIIGVMYDTSILTKDGAIITDEMASGMSEPPEEFHIANKAVIYKYLYPNIAAKIAKDAKANKLFVSMEVWFKRYDYKVGSKVVARNTETAFLDKFLRAKGGEGIYNGEKVGRVLRELTFGGVGLVANPANLDSVITSLSNASVDKTKEDTNVESISACKLGELSLLNAKEALQPMSDKEMNDKLNDLTKALSAKEDELKVASAETEKLSSFVDVVSTSLASGAEGIAKLISSDVAEKIAVAKPTEYMKVLHDGVAKVMADSVVAQEQIKVLTKQVADLEAAKTLAEVTAAVDALFKNINESEATNKLKAKVAKLATSMKAEERAEYLKDTADLLSIAEKPAFLKDKKEKDKMEEECASEEETDASVLDHVKSTATVLPAGTPDVCGQENPMQSLAVALLQYGKESQEVRNGSRS